MSQDSSKKKTKEQKKKPKVIYRPTGRFDHILFESVFKEKKPYFLIFQDGKFSLVDKLDYGDEILLPLIHEMFPYRPYTLDDEMLKELNSRIPDVKELYGLVYGEYEVFLDLEPHYKTLEVIQTLESYQQHKLMTTSYLYHQGDNNSGKSRALDIHNFLDYRPLYSPSLPPADVYSFLGYHEEGCGTILEDEAEDLGKPRYEEKMKLYRVGYRKGATVPRIEFVGRGTRKQRFFKAFCCKVFAGLWLPRDKGFKQRCIPISMVEGDPEKDEFILEDFSRFNNIKVKLLAWHMKTFFDTIPNIETGLGGRIKELWKPKLQMAYGTEVYDIISALTKEVLKRKEEQRRSCLEAYITRAVMTSYVSFEGREIPFSSIWDVLKNKLGVADSNEIEDKAGIVIGVNTPTFSTVSKTTVGLKLGSIFGGEKHLRTKLGRTWSFDRDKLLKLAKRYRLEPKDVNGLKGLNGFLGTNGFKKDRKAEEGEGKSEKRIEPKNRLDHLNHLGNEELVTKKKRTIEEIFEEFV